MINSFYSIKKFDINDAERLSQIISMNKDAAGPNKKDYDKFIQWNIKNPDDLYWKIVDNSPEGNGYMVGYIGYDDATKKITTSKISKKGDLFLEIYIDPNYINKGIGLFAFKETMKLLNITKFDKYKIFASTYISNTKAQKFFREKIGMNFVELNKKYNVIILSIDI